VKAAGNRQPAIGANRRREAGFTLLEVMIALAIVAVVLVALLGLENRTLEVSGRQQLLTRATLLAAARLAEVEAAPFTVLGDKAGSFDAPDEQFQWQMQVLATPLPQVARVEMTVAWGDLQRNEAVTLVSVVRRQETP